MWRIACSLLSLGLVACAGQPAATQFSSIGESASAPSSPAAAEPTASSSPGPDTLLGQVDIDAYEDAFGTSLTTATVEGGRIRYVAEVGQVGFDWMVDPSDPAKTIIQTGAGIDDISEALTSEEEAALKRWFTMVGKHQPEGVEWMRQRLDDYMSAPGAEMTINEDFGPVRSGFFTIVPPDFSDPDPMRPATLVGFYLEDAEALDR